MSVKACKKLIFTYLKNHVKFLFLEKHIDTPFCMACLTYFSRRGGTK